MTLKLFLEALAMEGYQVLDPDRVKTFIQRVHCCLPFLALTIVPFASYFYTLPDEAWPSDLRKSC